MKIRVIAVFVSSFLLSTSFHPVIAAEEEPLIIKPISGLRDTMKGITTSTVNWLNTQFAEGQENPQAATTSGSLSIDQLWNQNDGSDTKLRFRVKVKIPNLERRFYLFFGADDPRDVITNQPQDITRSEQLSSIKNTQEKRFFAGFGLSALDHLDFRIGFRGGIKPYAQTAYNTDFRLADNLAGHFGETIFWTNRQGFGSTTETRFDYTLSPANLLSWSSAATVDQDTTAALAWSSVFGYYRSISDSKTIAFEALINSQTGLDVAVAEYGLQTIYRQPIYNNWLFLDTRLAHFWQRPNSFVTRDGVWAGSVGLEIKF